MNISASSTLHQLSNLSILRSANKQPELALDLIMKTIDGLQPGGTMQSVSETVSPSATAPTATGQFIDIKV
ncbi:hypothetical protein [Desulfogranum japonicum]|uniref:hypothetical protein n=1 Tax=Desulfogranum japonicum TaxID=231447 RepID=UPI000405603E|nr:hypothetical protein [Desulfogranum japonicum]